MKWIDDIFSIVWDFWQWLEDTAADAAGWPLIGAGISIILYTTAGVVRRALTFIAYFGDWVDDTATKVADAFTRKEGAELSDYAKNILKTRIDEVDKLVSQLDEDTQRIIKPYLADLRGQVTELSDYAKNILAMDIKEMAKRLGLTEEQFRDWLRPKISVLEAALSSIVSSLKAEIETIDQIDNKVKGNTIAIGGNTSWINSVKQFTESIKKFFTDPEDWLYKAADRIIERFW